MTAIVTKLEGGNVYGPLVAKKGAAKKGDQEDAKSSTNGLTDTVQQSQIS